MSVAATTQFLAIFGIANYINIMVWQWLVEFTGGAVAGLTAITLLKAYDDAYKIASDDSSSAADKAKAENVMAGVWRDWVKGFIDSMSTEIIIYMQAVRWFKYNMYMAGKEDEIADKWNEGEHVEQMPEDLQQLFAF